MIKTIFNIVTKSKPLTIVIFFLGLYTTYISIHDHWFLSDEMQSRNATKETISDIENCFNGDVSNLLMYSVVTQSPDSDSPRNETVSYAAQIAERLASKGYVVQAFNRRYEDLAVIFDGVRVYSSATTSTTEIFVGNNSSSGTQVTCIPDTQKLGFDALDVGIKVFNMTNDGTSLEGVAKIGEDSPTSNKTFYFGTAIPSGESPYPSAGVY